MNLLPDPLGEALRGLGCSIDDVTPVAGGDICEAWRVRCAERTLFCKTTRSQHPGMFEIEAAGLDWLARSGAVAPAVVGAEDEHLILEWLHEAAPDPGSAGRFGASLAAVHSTAADSWGTAPPGVLSRTGYIGSAPMVFGDWNTCGGYLAEARILPMARLAHSRGGLTDSELSLMVSLAQETSGGRLVPDSGPRVVHGDLWSGNVFWTQGGAAMIDPAAHGGHPEEDLAMLQLFGVPRWSDILRGYCERAELAAGWQDRVALFQLYPLLVHAALFGGHYGSSAAAKARQYL